MLDITPFMFIVNEEYWIGYILRELCKVFPRVIVADTGSTDDTVAICRSFPQVAVRVFNPIAPGHIAPAQQWAIDQVQTEWALCVGGDEYYEESELLKIKELEIGDDKKVGWVTLTDLGFHDGQLYIRGQVNSNRILRAGTQWMGIHPWETIDSCRGLTPEERDAWVYFPIYGWHVRHLSRSSKDHEAYYRMEKLNFWEKSRWDLLERNPFAPIGRWKNPYLEAIEDVVTA